MSTWKEDREALRSYAKTPIDGQKATFIYVLISHMREKLHMKTYRFYHGGWKNLERERITAINTLSEQAEWIQYVLRQQDLIDKLGLQSSWLEPKLQEIARRVLTGYLAEEKDLAKGPSSPHNSEIGRVPRVMTLGARVRVALRALFGPIV